MLSQDQPIHATARQRVWRIAAALLMLAAMTAAAQDSDPPESSPVQQFMLQLKPGGTEVRASSGTPIFPNSDFEKGTLEGWRTEGEAFENHPTRGDNVARRGGEGAFHQGLFWVGTFEAYNGQGKNKPGAVQGDGPTGGLISQSFSIRKPYIAFRVGGGNGDSQSVSLLINGKRIHSTTGHGIERMRRVFWDVSGHIGDRAILYCLDSGDGPWEHINFDDFRFLDEAPDNRLFPNSDFEMGSLTNWRPTGDAFVYQPTKGDNVAERTAGELRAQPEGDYWIGTFERYRGLSTQIVGASNGDKAVGMLTSIPFKITGEVIAFKIGGSGHQADGAFLKIGGRRVREARGQNDETMRFTTWDVRPWRGETARIEIVDARPRGWAHVNVDDFRWFAF